MSVELAVVGTGLEKTFKDFWGRPKTRALRGVDLQIPKGCVFGLLGPNGAGKSTLIKLILGHLKPSSGRLQVLGCDPRDLALKSRLGYLPERSNLYRNLTCRETLRYFGAILGLSKAEIESRSAQLIEMTGLGAAADRLVGEFSHGMTRRMGLAQALLNDPEFVILDEPTAGLDPLGCREVKDLVINLGRRGKTVLMTSHLLADVEDTCSEIMMIYGGQVQSQGRLDELLADASRGTLDFPAVSRPSLAAAVAALARDADPADIRLGSPRQSLENFFIQSVRQGAAAGWQVSGAATGSGVAGFLKADESSSSSSIPLDPRIAELLALAAQNPTPVVAAPAETPAIQHNSSWKLEPRESESPPALPKRPLKSLVDESDAAADVKLLSRLNR